jgi:N6-adenosine-specific RNA methylase IME4
VNRNRFESSLRTTDLDLIWKRRVLLSYSVCSSMNWLALPQPSMQELEMLRWVWWKRLTPSFLLFLQYSFRRSHRPRWMEV